MKKIIKVVSEYYLKNKKNKTFDDRFLDGYKACIEDIIKSKINISQELIKTLK